MTSSKNTKRALLASVLSVALCCAMLIGSTFAWFTDSVSTSVNRIQAGTLKIALVDAEGNSLEGETLGWKAFDNRAQDQIFWEPNATYNTEEFYIKNDGNLNLKFKFLVTGIDGDAKLLEVIDFTAMAEASQFHFNTGAISITPGEGEQFDLLKGYTVDTLFYGEQHFDEYVLEPGETAGPITITGHMDKLAGNEYQGLSIDGIAITLIAAQATGDEDSFNGTYDADAEYPVVATDTDALTEIIQNASADEPVTVFLPAAGTYDLADGVAKGKDITIVGTKDTVVDICQDLSGESGNSGMNYQDGAQLTFKGVTVKGQNSGNFGGIVRAQVTFEDCVIQDTLTLYGDTVFKNCTLKSSTDRYNVWTWGASKVEFTDCTFDTAGKAILVYGGAGEHTDVIVSGCTFNDSSNGAVSKAAIETGNDYGATYNITINNTVVNDFAVNTQSNSKIWGNKNNMSKDELNVVIDGVDVY